MLNLFFYDLETFLNCFLFIGKFAGDPKIYLFEISDRKNQRTELLSFLNYLQNCGATMVGYNSLHFDYPILHVLMNEPYTFDAKKGYLLGQEIISQQQFGFERISMKERLIPQIDLLKVNHFDNPAKRTTLKALQFAMRSQSVEDLPFSPHEPLTFEQMDILANYGVHDLTETEAFGNRCMPAIVMRKSLLDDHVLGGDVLNYSDVKIGTEYLVRKIGRAKCYISGSTPRRSVRTELRFKDLILPKSTFREEKFDAVLTWFKEQKMFIGSENKPSLEAKLAGLDFYFGVGGVHASVENKIFHSTATHVIKDIDVSGMYVAVAIANGFYPEHLGQDFVTAYKQLQRDRAQYPKGSFMNLVLKLAGNGVYGNSNNQYSPFYDPRYTFSVTLNGQLQLLELVERLSLLPGLELIQANTDGITCLIPREMEPWFQLWKTDWESHTLLKLEEAEYTSMFIRDVNNYIAIDTKGKIKRKGAYWYPITEDDYFGSSGSNWNKDFSNLIAQKGVEQCLIYNDQPKDVVRLFTNPFDFMLRYKATGSAKVYIGDRQMSKTTRYYVCTNGQRMKKISEPKGVIGDFKRRNALTDEFFKTIKAQIPEGSWDERIHTKNKSRYQMLETSIENGWLVKECNNANDFSWHDVDFKYYANEITKLLIGRTQ